MIFGLYMVAGLVIALMTLIESRHSKQAEMWMEVVAVVAIAPIWPIVVIVYVFGKIAD